MQMAVWSYDHVADILAQLTPIPSEETEGAQS